MSASAGVVRIPLRRRDGGVCAYALVDDSDAHLANDRWYLLASGYVGRGGPWRDKPRRFVYLHRAILGLAHGDRRQADHINRDKLDNRRANLRIATRGQNMQNLNAHARSTSRFRGVHWHRRRRYWVAIATLDGRDHYLGSFGSELDAAEAAARWRAAHMPFANESALLRQIHDARITTEAFTFLDYESGTRDA